MEGRGLGAEAGAAPFGVLASAMGACVTVGAALTAKAAPFVIINEAGLLLWPPWGGRGVGAPSGRWPGLVRFLPCGGAKTTRQPPVRACCVEVGRAATAVAC